MRTLSRLLTAPVVLFSLSVGPSTAAEPAAGRAFTLEDLYRAVVVKDPALSPDGSLVAYGVETRDLPRGKANDDLYLVPSDGGEPRRLTFTASARESSPVWSPDGQTLAFVADRDGDSALWLLPVRGGEARKLVSASGGVSDPVWSPDGRLIAFASSVWPQCGADEACNQRLDRWKEKGPLDARVADELLYRHWASWGDGKVTHVLAVEVGTGAVRDLTPGDRDAPVFSLDGGGFAFSPDGKELAYTRNPEPRSALAWTTNSDVFVVAVAPGPDGKPAAPRNLTADNKAWDGDPSFSPDGKFIAYRRQAQPGYEADLFTLAVIERASGRSRVLTAGHQDWVTHAEWLPDSRGLVFQSDAQGDTPLYRIGLDGGTPVELARSFLHAWALAPDGQAAVAVRSAVGAPHELWRFEFPGAKAPAGEAPRRLTRHNADLEREIDVRPAERVWVTGKSGRKVHAFVVKPHGFDPSRKYPVILNVHGGPQMMWADSFRGDWQVYPGAGYVVVFPNPTGSTGYGQAFTAAISGDYTGAVMQDIHAVADWIDAQPWTDRGRVGAMGWSWGGYAMNWLLGTTGRFKAIASMMGMYDISAFWGSTEELWYPEWDLKGTPWTSKLYEEHSPRRNEASFATPTLVITGEKDFRVPYTQSLQLHTALRRRGVPSRLVVLPNAGHWPSWYEMALYYTAHLEWFHQYLGGGPPPWSTEDFAYNRVFDPETGRRRAAN